MRYFFHRDDKCLNLKEKLIGLRGCFLKAHGSLYCKPKRRHSEGHRGSLYEAQEEAIGYGWFCFKRDFTGKPSFWNLEQFHREIILSGFYPSAGDSLYWKPNRRLLRDFQVFFLFNAQDKTKLNEGVLLNEAQEEANSIGELSYMKPKRRLNSKGELSYMKPKRRLNSDK